MMEHCVIYRNGSGMMMMMMKVEIAFYTNTKPSHKLLPGISESCSHLVHMRSKTFELLKLSFLLQKESLMTWLFRLKNVLERYLMQQQQKKSDV